MALLTCVFEGLNQAKLTTDIDGISFINSNLLIDKAYDQTVNYTTLLSLPCNFKTKDVQKIFLNFIITVFCDFLKNYCTKKYIFIFHEKNEVENLVVTSLQALNLKFICINMEFDTFLQKVRKDDQDIRIEIEKVKCFKHKKTYKKMSSIIKKYGLTSLNEYFKKPGNKLVLLK